MRTLAIIVTLALAFPAAAQGYKPFKPAGFQPPPRAPSAPSFQPLPTSPSVARPNAGTPQSPATPPAFKPYEPWKPAAPTSLYGPDGKRKKAY